MAPVLSSADGETFWNFVADCVDLQNEQDPKLRALWGDVRAALGCDRRFDKTLPIIMTENFPGHTEEQEPIPGFVCVPAGKFSMGSEHEDDKTSNPRREAEIKKDFYMHRTLVTVDQFAGFVMPGGYDTDKWWDKQGLDWRDGHLDSTLADDYYKKHLARRGKELRRKPMHWDTQISFRSHPVWGVNWFEVRAYCRWLNAQMAPQINAIASLKDHEVQLPTELQWERAARASSLTETDQRVWPWGADEGLAEQKANFNQSIGSVCTVGMYEANPIGLFDMAGNVWEWMDNLYHPEPDAFARIPRDRELKRAKGSDASDRPAVRGGAWFEVPDGARCSRRGGGLDGGWDGYIGFRVVLSLAE